VSFEIHFHAIPDGLFVCHHCDTPSCVRPEHLFLGTVVDNARDAQWKGRIPVADRKRTPVKVENKQRRCSDAELRLNARVRRVMGEWRGEDGRPPSRAIGRILYDEQRPLGMLGRRLVEAKRGRMPLQKTEQLLDEVRDWLVNDLYAGAR
jgi:hypothetical protein